MAATEGCFSALLELKAKHMVSKEVKQKGRLKVSGSVTPRMFEGSS